MPKRSVVLLHNIPSPYRLPVFEELSSYCNLLVLFCTSSHNDRCWEPDLSAYTFRHTFLHSYKIGLFYISFSVVLNLIRENPDEIIISENPPMLPITVFAICTGKCLGSSVTIWNEAWNEDVIGHLGIRSQSRYYMVISYVCSRVIRGYRIIIYSASNRFVAFSEMAEDYLHSLGVDRSEIEVCHQVMPSSELPEPTADNAILESFSEDALSVLYLGYLRPSKGIKILMEACDGIDDIELIIAGSGEEKYEQELHNKGETMKNVDFLGHISERKGDCYTNADVCVLPTERDAWGLVINESLYYGTPVITTEAAGGKEIINQNGFIVPSGDVSALRNVLHLCIEPSVLKSITPKFDCRQKVTDPNIMAQALSPISERQD